MDSSQKRIPSMKRGSMILLLLAPKKAGCREHKRKLQVQHASSHQTHQIATLTNYVIILQNSYS